MKSRSTSLYLHHLTTKADVEGITVIGIEETIDVEDHMEDIEGIGIIEEGGDIIDALFTTMNLHSIYRYPFINQPALGIDSCYNQLFSSQHPSSRPDLE